MDTSEGREGLHTHRCSSSSKPWKAFLVMDLILFLWRILGRKRG